MIIVFTITCICRCRSIAAKVLSERNGDSQHVIHAMAHCHIDSGTALHVMNSCSAGYTIRVLSQVWGGGWIGTIKMSNGVYYLAEGLDSCF